MAAHGDSHQPAAQLQHGSGLIQSPSRNGKSWQEQKQQGLCSHQRRSSECCGLSCCVQAVDPVTLTPRTAGSMTSEHLCSWHSHADVEGSRSPTDEPTVFRAARMGGELPSDLHLTWVTCQSSMWQQQALAVPPSKGLN